MMELRGECLVLRFIALFIGLGFAQFALCSEPLAVKLEGGETVHYSKLQRVKSSSLLYRSFRKYFEPIWEKERNELAAEMREGANFQISGDLPLYLVSTNCGGQNIVLLAHSELKIKDASNPSPRPDSDNEGSGGSPVEIYAGAEGASRFSLLSRQSVISMLGLDTRKMACPNLVVEVHGSEFERVGNDYGTAELVYRPKTKRYELSIPKRLKGNH
jgi:hypothetical protein